MKAITLGQPSATLVAIGAKRAETRSWSTRYRGPIAIYADSDPAWLDSILGSAPGTRFFNRVRLVLERYGLHRQDQFPLGAVVATALLADCLLITDALVDAQDEDEVALDFWVPGRFAFIFADVQRLDPPQVVRPGWRNRLGVRIRGTQQLWDWTPTR